jgi:pimeloyl-ACP methyl ester carboxylesterase
MVVSGRFSGSCGPVALCLHGFPDFWASLEPLASRINPNGRNVFLDLRGFGDSASRGPGHDYRLSSVANDITAAIDWLGVDKVTFVGHDWGAAVGWLLWMRNPAAIARYFLLSSPNPYAFFEAMQDPQQWEMSAYARDLARSESGEALEIAELSRWTDNPNHREALKDALSKSSPSARSGYYGQNYPQSKKAFDLPVVKGKRPLLLVYGMDDPYIASRSYELSRSFATEDCRIRGINGGHFIHFNNSDEVADIFHEWVNQDGR